MICFIHIERAGGTTLHHIFRNNTLRYLTLSPPYWTNDEGTVFTAEHLRGLLRFLPLTVAFGGHNTRTYLGYETAVGRPISYITFLRDPVERYISHLTYQLNRPSSVWSVDRFLSTAYFDNFMTRRVAGEPDLAKAKARLAHDYSFVGLQERFDESLILMTNALPVSGLDIRHERRNIAPVDRVTDAVRSRLTDSAFRTAVEQRNKLDIELYAFASDTLYSRWVAEAGPTLRHQVRRFQHANAGFRFNPLRLYAARACRLLLYHPVERWVNVKVGRRFGRRSRSEEALGSRISRHSPPPDPSSAHPSQWRRSASGTAFTASSGRPSRK